MGKKGFIHELKLKIIRHRMDYTAMHDIKSFNRLFDRYPQLTKEVIAGYLKRIENVELPPEFTSPEYEKEQWESLCAAIEKKAKKRIEKLQSFIYTVGI